VEKAPKHILCDLHGRNGLFGIPKARKKKKNPYSHPI